MTDPIYHARGTAVPVCLSINVTSISLVASGSSSKSLAFSPGDSESAKAYSTVYEALRSSIEISLEALYPIGHNASNRFIMGLPFDQLPHPTETGAEIIVEQVALSVPLWDTGLAYTGVGDRDRKEKSEDLSHADEKASVHSDAVGGTSIGVEAWLQGEIIPRGNMMPDFISPNVRLTVRPLIF